jgi:hypothetical protein
VARVVLIAPSLPPSPDPEALLAWRLANSLAECQHEIKLLTGKHPYQLFPQFHPRVELLQIFQRWSVFEIPKILQILHQWRPEVLHLLPPPQLSPVWMSLPFTAGLMNPNKPPKVVLSFWRLPSSISKIPMHRADAITVANDTQKHILSSRPGQLPHIETLELIDSRVPFDSKSDILPDEKFCPFLFIPGNPQDHHDFEQTLSMALATLKEHSSWHIISAGSLSHFGYKREQEWQLKIRRENLTGKWYFAGDLDLTSTDQFAKLANVVLGSHLKIETAVLPIVTHACRTSGIPLILNHLQAQADPFPWAHGDNVLLSGRDGQEQIHLIGQILKDSQLRHKFSVRLLGLSDHNLTDHFSNIMSRVYSTRAQNFF